MMRRTAVLAKEVDWAGLAAKVHSDGAKQAIMSLRATVARVDSRYKAFSSPPPEINFDEWRKKVQNKDAVTAIEIAYKRAPKPKMYAEPLASDEARTEALWKVIEDKVLEAKTKATAVQTTINNLDAMKLVDTTTIDDVYKWYPELQKEIDEEIAAEEWFVDTISPKDTGVVAAAEVVEGGPVAEAPDDIEPLLPPKKELTPEETYDVIRAWHAKANPSGPELPAKDSMPSFYKKQVADLHAAISAAVGK